MVIPLDDSFRTCSEFFRAALRILWESRNLPPPSYHYGKYGLLALQEAEQRRTGYPFTFIGDWQNQVDQLLLQEEAKHHQIRIPLRILRKAISNR